MLSITLHQQETSTKMKQSLLNYHNQAKKIVDNSNTTKHGHLEVQQQEQKEEACTAKTASNDSMGHKKMKYMDYYASDNSTTQKEDNSYM
jgi:hypothetical protein